MYIVANHPGTSRTLPDFLPLSRKGSRLTNFAALSQNPACFHKWGHGTSINSVYYQISDHISWYLVGMVVHNRPKVREFSSAIYYFWRVRLARLHYRRQYRVQISGLVYCMAHPKEWTKKLTNPALAAYPCGVTFDHSLTDPTLRGNPFPKVTDLFCWLPLPTLFYQ